MNITKAIKNRPQKTRPTTPEKRRVLWQRYEYSMMKRYLIMLLSFWSCFALAEENLSPVDVNASPLSEYTASDKIESKAIAAVKLYLESKNENISDFYVSKISKNSKEQLVIPLWHRVAFTMPIYPGNPGGKNRNIIYDISKGVAVRQEWWQ